MDNMILASCAVLALLLLANIAVSIWQGRQERELRMAMEDWKRAASEFETHAGRAARDARIVLDKLEDVCAEQIQDWNTVQRQMAQVDGRLGQVERRFGPLEPLAPIDARVDEVPETMPDGPVPVEQEVSHD